jgi:ribonuclease PH
VEIQGTAESGTFSRQDLDRLTALGEAGIASLVKIQREVLGRPA